MNGRESMELARAYIKIQEYTKRWPPLEALSKGTIFPELYSPYKPGRKGEQPRDSTRTVKRGGILRG